MRSCFLLHRWTVIEKEILPSAFEQMIENGMKVKVTEGADAEGFNKPAIVTSRCEHCGTMRVQRI